MATGRLTFVNSPRPGLLFGRANQSLSTASCASIREAGQASNNLATSRAPGMARHTFINTHVANQPSPLRAPTHTSNSYIWVAGWTLSNPNRHCTYSQVCSQAATTSRDTHFCNTTLHQHCNVQARWNKACCLRCHPNLALAHSSSPFESSRSGLAEGKLTSVWEGPSSYRGSVLKSLAMSSQ